MDMVERVAIAMWFDHVDLQGYPNGCPTWDEMLLMPSEQGVVEEVRSNAKAAIRAMLEGLEPVASLYTMHMELNQTCDRLDNPGLAPFGIPGRDYSEEYTVTETPLYDLSALKEAVK